MEATAARAAHKGLDAVHTMIYFAPEAAEEYSALGFDNTASQYFPARAAALGRVPWQVVQAAFFNFSPFAVELGMTGAWEKAAPEVVLDARYRAVDRTLRRMCGDLLDDVGPALDLARDAAQGCRPEGRPLYAAHASLAWPDQPHLALWHALTLLREHRGDGHICALLAVGLTAPESIVLNGAYVGSGMTEFMRRTRGWAPQQWEEAVESLQARGWLDAGGSLTEAGRTARDGIEVHTDELALPPYRALGPERLDELLRLVHPLKAAIVESGVLPATSVRR